MKQYLRIMHAPAADQAGVQDKVENAYVGHESRRLLSTVNYASNTNVVLEIPRDSSYKRMSLLSRFACTATYASGSPTISPFGALARLMPNFTLVADGYRNVKVLDIYMQRCMNALAWGTFPRRARNTGASLTGTNTIPATEHYAGTIAYGSTTQDIVYMEQVGIDFEVPRFLHGIGRQFSQLYARNLQSLTATFGFGDVTSLQTTGVAAPVVYTNVSLAITPVMIEDRFADINSGAFDFNEFVVRRTYSSAQSNAQILLSAGNKLLGVGIMAQNGDSALSLSDVVLTNINLFTNGVNPIVKDTFLSLQSDNKMRQGISDDQFASSLHAMTGFAHINLVKDSDIRSGLATDLASGISTVELQVDTGAASGLNAVTYTNGVTISVLQQQLVKVPAKG